MRTLKIVFVMILLSLFMTSCTDLINSDDETVLNNIENTQGVDFTGDGNDGTGSGGGKGD